jgi:hypothetical protein
MKTKFFLIALLLLSPTIISATCSLDVTLINQDPYPAVPGDYVNLVFQITGVENPECGKVSFELLEKYPISFDPSESNKIQINSGTYQKDYSSYLIASFKVRLDEHALDGANKIETLYGRQDLTSSHQIKNFNLEVQDTHADFEIHIDKYSPTTKELTVEILNIAKIDVEALTVEIPKQPNADVRGTNRIVVGNLDSNEYTTADFKADLTDGEISFKILYTAPTGDRREVTKTTVYDSAYFTPKDGDTNISIWVYIIGAIILIIIVRWLWKKRKKKNSNRHH